MNILNTITKNFIHVDLLPNLLGKAKTIPSDYKLSRIIAMGHRVVITMDPTVAAKPDTTSQVLILNSKRRPFSVIKYET